MILAGCLARGEADLLKVVKDNIEGLVARSGETDGTGWSGAGEDGRLEGRRKEGALRVYISDEVKGTNCRCGN